MKWLMILLLSASIASGAVVNGPWTGYGPGGAPCSVSQNTMTSHSGLITFLNGDDYYSVRTSGAQNKTQVYYSGPDDVWIAGGSKRFSFRFNTANVKPRTFIIDATISGNLSAPGTSGYNALALATSATAITLDDISSADVDHEFKPKLPSAGTDGRVRWIGSWIVTFNPGDYMELFVRNHGGATGTLVPEDYGSFVRFSEVGCHAVE